MAYVQEGQEYQDNTIQTMNRNWRQRLGVAAILLEEYTISKLSRIPRLFQAAERQGSSEQEKLSEQPPEIQEQRGLYLKECHNIDVSMNNGGGTRTFTVSTRTRLS